MLDRAPVIQDNDLRRTSAWGNTFLGRDHFATGSKAALSATAPVPAPARPAAPAAPAKPAAPASIPAAPAIPATKPEKGPTA